ncbi:hypothetical protein EJD97_008413, partial [Solanum chilense]
EADGRKNNFGNFPSKGDRAGGWSKFSNKSRKEEPITLVIFPVSIKDLHPSGTSGIVPKGLGLDAMFTKGTKVVHQTKQQHIQ